MKKTLATWTLAIVAACGFVGCDSTDKAGKGPGNGKPAADPHGDHADNLHDGHSHAEHGPHDGELIELGRGEYHAEVVHDDAAGKVTVYLLDGSAKEPVGVAEDELTLNVVAAGKTTQFKLAAVPGGSTRTNSQFESSDAELGQALDAKDLKGRMTVTVDGKPYSGELTAHDHDHDHH